MQNSFSIPAMSDQPVNDWHLMIGKVASLYDISVQTLRHYDKIGLFQPDITNPDTGYRYYTVPQLQKLELILFLRRLNLSLSEIQDAVNILDHSGSFQEVLSAQDQALEAKMQELSQLRSQIRGLLALPETSSHGMNRVTIQECTPPRHFLVKSIPPLSVHTDNFPLKLMTLRKELLGSLSAIQTEYSFGATVSRAGFSNTGRLCYNSIFLDPGLYGGKAPSEAMEVPEGFYATIRFDRTQTQPETAYHMLTEFLTLHNFRSDDTIWELGVDASFSSISKISTLTELQVRIHM